MRHSSSSHSSQPPVSGPDPTPTVVLLTYASFAFVEYESRRDADDAYHEMHNKRIGRDDLLKIEVRPMPLKHLPADNELVGSNTAFCLMAIRLRTRSTS
jgi:hypothetical protein